MSDHHHHQQQTFVSDTDNILSVDDGLEFDESINRIEWHTHQPYVTTTFNSNDEIRIPIQQQDMYTLPSLSFIYIEGRVETSTLPAPTDPKQIKLINNGIAYLFDEIRYELNGIEIDRTKTLGITSTVKGYTSFTPNEVKALENAGWTMSDASNSIYLNSDFNVCIPLKMLLGFAEDFNKIVMNTRQELVLIRSKTDNDAVICSLNDNLNVNVKITKVQWRVPYVYVANPERLSLLKLLDRNKSLYMNFRSWSTYEYPMLPTTSRHTWTVKTSAQLEKPRNVLVAFQTNRKYSIKMDTAAFDHCNITNIKLYLNSEYYPYDNLNLDIENNKFALVYDMYRRFQASYYGRTGYHGEPLLGVQSFKTIAPIYVIDCSRQNESLKSAPVDIQLQFESKEAFPENTSAYCIILHDRAIQYNPLTSIVKTL